MAGDRYIESDTDCDISAGSFPQNQQKPSTLPETNIAPENKQSEKDISFSSH